MTRAMGSPSCSPSPARRAALLALGATALLALPASATAACTATDALTRAGLDVPSFAGGDVPNATGCIEAALTSTAPLQVDPGSPAAFDGSASLNDAGTGDGGLEYAWHFGDELDPQAVTAPDPSPTVQHTYSARGHDVAWLVVTDTSVNPPVQSAPSSPRDVYVSLPPVAAFTVPNGGVLRPGAAFAFDASGSSAPGGSIDHYVWDWGDGSPPQTVPAGTTSVQHTFAADGASSGVTLTVVNDVGLASVPVTQAVTVQDQLPVVQLQATPSSVTTGQTVALSAARSYDPDGTIAEYRWDRDANGSYETSTGTTPSTTVGPFPNPGVITLRVKAIDDSGEASVRAVNVTVTDPGGGGGAGGSGSAGSGGGTGGGPSGGGPSGSASGDGDSGGSAAAGGGPSTTAADTFALGLSGVAIQRLANALRRGVALVARANRTAAGTLTLTLAPADARALGLARKRTRKPVAIGTLRIRLRPGHPAKPSVKLTSRATHALRRIRFRTLRVTVHGTLATATEHTSAVRIVLLRG
jgi:hypothetical protein